MMLQYEEECKSKSISSLKSVVRPLSSLSDDSVIALESGQSQTGQLCGTCEELASPQSEKACHESIHAFVKEAQTGCVDSL